MGEYLEIAGHQIWVERLGVQGDRAETIVLLHGGLSNSDHMVDTIGSVLAQSYRVVAFDRRGHGRTADTDAPFHYQTMAVETIALLEAVVGGPAHLVGASDGANVAMLVALSRPDLVKRLVLNAANFHFEGLRPLDLTNDAAVLEMIAQDFGQRLPDGAEHFPTVLAKTIIMFSAEPVLTTEEIHRIAAPSLVLVGDDDLIHLSHTCALYEALPHGQLAVVPGASHLLIMEKTAEVARLVIEFLKATVPPVTLMPSRRSRDSWAVST